MTNEDGVTEFDERIISLAEETHRLGQAYSADSGSLDALANRLYDRWLTPFAQVAVVGPISSGKTMLINALLGRRLLPTDSRTWTSTWVQVYQAPVFTAVAMVRTASGLEEQPIGEEELETYLTVGGEPQIRRYHGRHATVVSVAIGIPFTSFGESLRLLDTPGTGGLRDAHLHTARAAIARADAVIFVSKPDTPISASERKFLAEAVRRVETCILVFTHRDILSGRDADDAVIEDTAALSDRAQWEQIVDSADDACGLAERFAKVIAVSVSSLNWLDAQGQPEGAQKAGLSAVSNFQALTDAINSEIVQRIAILHRRNVLILCDLLNRNVVDRVTHTRLLLLGDPAAEAVQKKREEDIAKWTADNGDAWAKSLDKRRNALHERFAELAAAKVSDLDSTYRQELLQMSSADRASAIQLLSEQPDVLLEEMTALGAREISAALEDVRRLLDEDDLGASVAQLIASRAVSSRLTDPARPGEATVGFDAGDVRNMIAGAMVGGGAAGLAVTVGLVAATPLIFLAPIILGAALFGGLTRMQKATARAGADAVDYLGRIENLMLSEAVKIATTAADAAADAIRAEITLALAGQEAEIKANRKAMDDAKAASAEQRERKIAECETLIARATELQTEGHDIETALRERG